MTSPVAIQPLARRKFFQLVVNPRSGANGERFGNLRALSPLLLADGLYFVGLDVIGNFLTEVNVTSPTGIQEINALNGVRLESNVVEFVEQQVESMRKSPSQS